MLPTNEAAWLDNAGTPLRVGPADFPSAGRGEVVIRGKALAINPFSCMSCSIRQILRGVYPATQVYYAPSS